MKPDSSKVASYQNIAWEGAWKSRARAIWAIAAMGLATGAAIGLIAPLFPVAVGAYTIAEAAAAIPASLAFFSAIGMSSGFVVGGLCGATSGAAASVAKEGEARTRAALAESGIQLSPSTASEKPKERLFNPRVSLTFAAIGAVSGLILSAGFLAVEGASSMALVQGIDKLLGPELMSNAAAVTAYFTGVMTSFGAIFGINYPKISVAVSDFTGDLLSGKVQGKTWEVSPTPAVEKPVPSQSPAQAPEAPARRHQSFQDMIARSAQANDKQLSL